MRPFAVLTTLFALLALSGASVRGNADATPPNIVFLLTDDQSYAEMASLPKTTDWIGAHGRTYTNFFGAFPLCCPARVSLQTGQYPHNHHVTGNEASRHWKNKQDALGPWLSAAGYETAYIGKFANGFRARTQTPPGWDPAEWWGGEGGHYCGFELHDPATNTAKQYGKGVNPCDPNFYVTDVVANLAVDVLKRRLPSPQPLFLMVGFTAPHKGVPLARGDTKFSAVPPTRYRGAYANVPLPKPPSFNEADVTDKPRRLQLPKMSEDGIKTLQETWRRKQETLMGVDDAVASIMQTLAESGELDNTLVLFSSDNGFMTGEHRMQHGKEVPYDESVKLPLLIRGPGIPASTVDANLRSSIDITTTLVRLTGATTTGHPLDGKPLDGPARTELLYEGADWSALRTNSYVYIRYDAGYQQLYDMLNDPWQLQSLHADPAYAGTLAEMAARLDAVQDCVGSACP